MAESSYVNIDLDKISEALNEKMDRNLSNTDAIGQAILDGKVEVEALLEQNGYAKFTWKEGNKTSKLIVQWGWIVNNPADTWTSYSYPLSVFMKSVVVSGLDTYVQAARDNTQYMVKFKTSVNTNIEYVLIGY